LSCLSRAPSVSSVLLTSSFFPRREDSRSLRAPRGPITTETQRARRVLWPSVSSVLLTHRFFARREDLSRRRRHEAIAPGFSRVTAATQSVSPRSGRQIPKSTSLSPATRADLTPAFSTRLKPGAIGYRRLRRLRLRLRRAVSLW
jgi:hypothetical protein